MRQHALQYFYEEQLHRMECLSQEPVLFEDVLCQIHDMVQPAVEGIFTLQDLKRQKSLAGILFNILFNLNKFIAFETRDPFVVRQVRCGASPASSLTIAITFTLRVMLILILLAILLQLHSWQQNIVNAALGQNGPRCFQDAS